MENQSKKKLLIIFLLLHGIVINFHLFPILYLYSELNSLHYLTLSEWVKSICINLFTWQFLFYISKRKSGMDNEIQLVEELKKFRVIMQLHRSALKIFSSPLLRRTILNVSIISVIFLNFIFPLVATLFFDFRINFTYGCIWFIVFQLSFFLFYYLQEYFPEDESEGEFKFHSPWFIDEIIGRFYTSKV